MLKLSLDILESYDAPWPKPNQVSVLSLFDILKNCILTCNIITGGSSIIGDYCFIGVNTILKNSITIGSNCKLGIYSNNKKEYKWQTFSTDLKKNYVGRFRESLPIIFKLQSHFKFIFHIF